MKTDYDPAHAKFERLLRLIKLLRPPGVSKKALAQHFDCNLKTINRYFNTLERADIFTDVDEAGRWFITEPLARGITVHLADEEAGFLFDLINAASPEHPLGATILSKMLFYTELGQKVKNKFRRTLPEVIQNLSSAMRSNRQVLISEYISASSGKKLDRLLQPLNFTSNMTYLLAYEAEVNRIVNLKTDRITGVTILEARCTIAPDVKLDVFQIAANNEEHRVVLLLNTLAYRLLIEQYPETETHFTDSENEAFPFRFATITYNLLPVGRFILGLPGSIIVEQPEALKKYLRQKITDFTF